MSKKQPGKVADTDHGLNGEEEGGMITKTGMKKTIWVHHDEAEALRDAAYRLRRTESSIIRQAIRTFLGVED